MYHLEDMGEGRGSRGGRCIPGPNQSLWIKGFSFLLWRIVEETLSEEGMPADMKETQGPRVCLYGSQVNCVCTFSCMIVGTVRVSF